MTIRLRDKMLAQDGWGRNEGRRVHEELLTEVTQNPNEVIFRISLDDVRRTDASFPRESVCEVAYRFRGKKGFCIVDADNPDLLDNWDAAARKREQPLLAWLKDGSYQLLGQPTSEGTRAIFEMVVASNGLTTGEVVQSTKQNLSNVSNKLKSLWNDGYILRRERVATTGGIEFEYFVAK